MATQDQLIDDYQLYCMRDMQLKSYPDLVDVYRLSRVADGKGGFSPAQRSLVVDEVACTITPAQQLVMGGQADRGLEVEKWTVRLPWGTDVQDADLLHWASEGIWLQVEDAKVSKTRGTAVSCMAEKVKGAIPGVD